MPATGGATGSVEADVKKGLRNCTSDDGSVCEWEVRGGAERACAHDYSELCVRDFERLKVEAEMSKKEKAMKRLVEEVSGEGLESLLGENVTLWCECYIYAGKLIGANEQDVLLEDAKIVYETGGLTDAGFKDAQPLPGPWYVRTAKIESYGKMS